jgi:hypothetical protein
MRWSIIEPWTFYMKLLLARPNWERINLEELDPSLSDFLRLLRADMESWVSAIPVPRSFEHMDAGDAVSELNVILGFVRRSGGLAYLDELVSAGKLPLRYRAEQEQELLEALRSGGRTPEEIERILYSGSR